MMVRWRLKLPSDYETKASYSFNVHVSDGELIDTQSVIINITDVEGDEFRVNTETFDLQAHSKITSLNDGGFVIIWDGQGNQDGA